MEEIFSMIMKRHLRDSGIEVTHPPEDLREIYDLLPPIRRYEILGVAHESQGPHGVGPEFCLHNTDSGKQIYVKIQSQLNNFDGHECVSRYLMLDSMPDMVESIQDIANQPADVYPVWVVFTKGLAKSPRMRQEIQHWFKGIERNVLLWKDLEDHEVVISHFEQHIRPLLN